MFGITGQALAVTFSFTRRSALSLMAAVIAWPWGSAMAAELPGSNQVQIRYPSSLRPIERHAVILQGATEQALSSLSISDSASLQPYLRLDYKVDSEDVSSNNKIHPSTGLKLRFMATHHLMLELGGRYEWEHRFIDGSTYQGTSGFFNWSGYWEIAAPPRETAHDGPLGYVISSWGQLRYPSAQIDSERSTMLLEGGLQGDMDWLSLLGESRLALRGDLEFSTDSAGQDYNNKLIPSLGLVLKMPSGALGRFEIGARYALDYRPVTNTVETGLIGFAGWSVGWKL